MGINKNNVTDFPNNIDRDILPVDSSLYSKCDIIELRNDGSGGGGMNYITREEFNAKMETIDVKFKKLEDKIDYSAKNISSEIKNSILKSEKEQRKWFIGTIIVPIALFILSKCIWI